MGSSLEHTFDKYYMAHWEENAFANHPDLVLTMCAWYVDDIFLVDNNQEQLHNI